MENEIIFKYATNESEIEKISASIFGEMREATKEERKSIINYMKNVGVKTGIKFDIYKKEKMGG